MMHSLGIDNCWTVDDAILKLKERLKVGAKSGGAELRAIPQNNEGAVSE
jgi:hypothetical protein